MVGKISQYLLRWYINKTKYNLY